MEELEKKYTSTSNKLLAHPELIEDIKKGLFRPMSLQLAPTDKCNLNCNMCSVKEREMNELSISEIISTLDEFKKLGAKTVELTGGGDPTMYKYIDTVLEVAKVMGYEIFSLVMD